ncbi:MAG TPA: DUF5658 family protein [Acidobacteriota bacterium]|nr:DUF5658 family protein [Acidobacteriota bacterium]
MAAVAIPFSQYHKVKCSGTIMLSVLSALLLSMTDGALTLRLLELGARELNPVMRFYLELGPGMFIAFKYLLTSSGLLFLVMHQKRSFFGGQITGRQIIFTTPVIFALVVCYQVTLIALW